MLCRGGTGQENDRRGRWWHNGLLLLPFMRFGRKYVYSDFPVSLLHLTTVQVLVYYHSVHVERLIEVEVELRGPRELPFGVADICTPKLTMRTVLSQHFTLLTPHLRPSSIHSLKASKTLLRGLPHSSSPSTTCTYPCLPSSPPRAANSLRSRSPFWPKDLMREI